MEDIGEIIPESGQWGSRGPSIRANELLLFVTGLLLPLYLTDESTAIKALATPLVAVAVVGVVVFSRYDFRLVPPLARMCALVFGCAYFLSAFLALSLWSGTSSGIGMVYPLVFFFLSCRRPDAINKFWTGMFIGLLVIIGLGWYRFVTGHGGALPEHALGYWGIKYSASTRNNDALAPLLLAAVVLGFLLVGRNASRRTYKVLSWAILALGVATLVLTFSRGAWLAFLFLLVLAARVRASKLVGAGIAVVSLLLVIGGTIQVGASNRSLLASPLISARLQSIYDPSLDVSNQERIRLLEYGLEVSVDNPVFGVGAGNFNCCTSRYGFPDLEFAKHPENLLLHVASEYGLLSSLSVLGYLIVFAARGVRATNPRTRYLASVIVSVLLWLQFNSELSSLLMWVCLGMACSEITPDWLRGKKIYIERILQPS